MNASQLAELLHRRLSIIGDHEWRDRDPDGQFAALKEVSEAIDRWHREHRHEIDARLDHFLTGASYEKALRYVESEGSWRGH
ncbi:hypothetical protein [Haloferula rosea]|nr:hypothetical protein [Haloferula rosea]